MQPNGRIVSCGPSSAQHSSDSSHVRSVVSCNANRRCLHPNCRTTDRCSRESDGSAGFCRNISAWQPGDRIKTDRSGEEYCLVLPGSSGVGNAPEPSEEPFQFEQASPEVLDSVYTDVLASFRPVLSTLEDLYRRGFTPDEVQRLGYGRALDDDRITLSLERKFGRSALTGTPGFWQGNDGIHLFTPNGGQIAVPVRNVDGQISALRIRTNNPKRKWIWWSYPAVEGFLRPEFKAMVHVPLHTPDMRNGTVILTEGEIKADLTTLRTGVLCLSIPGVSQWSLVIPVLKDLGVRRVVIAYDADARRKPSVAGALQRCAAALAADGYQIAVAVWPDEFKGIDDLVVGHPAGAWAIELREGREAWGQIADLVASSGAKPDPCAGALAVLDGIEDRVRSNPKVAFDVDVMSALYTLQKHNPAQGFERRASLKNLLKGQVREWEAAIKNTFQQFKKAERIGSAPPVPSERASLPEILIDFNEKRVAYDTVAALAKNATNLYQRDCGLVQTVGSDSSLAIRRVEPYLLRQKCSESARFVERSTDDDGNPVLVETSPPQHVYMGIFQQGDYPGIRELRGIARYPVMRPDGTFITEPGFDEATGLYASFDPIEVPAQSTLDDARSAIALLKEPFCDFPFKNCAHVSTVLSAILTLVARPALPQSPVPFFAIDANVAGPGKGKICTLIGLIATGQPMVTSPFSGGEEEIRKNIFASVLAGDTPIFFDNVGCLVDSPALAALITSPGIWSDRVLGHSEKPRIPYLGTVFATGINLQFSAEINRRVAHCRLESQDASPDRRDGFKYPQVERWTLEHRDELLRAAITVLQAFVQSGRPDMHLPGWGSFENWTSLIRNALVWVGEVDPGEVRNETKAGCDPETTALGDLLEHWGEVSARFEGRAKTSELLGVLIQNDLAARKSGEYSEPLRFMQFRTALSVLCGTRVDQTPDAKTFGKTLARYRDRIVNGRKLVGAQDRKGIVRWQVVKVDVPHAETKEVSPKHGVCGICLECKRRYANVSKNSNTDDINHIDADACPPGSYVAMPGSFDGNPAGQPGTLSGGDSAVDVESAGFAGLKVPIQYVSGSLLNRDGDDSLIKESRVLETEMLEQPGKPGAQEQPIDTIQQNLPGYPAGLVEEQPGATRRHQPRLPTAKVLIAHTAAMEVTEPQSSDQDDTQHGSTEGKGSRWVI